jgi:hypothetical protein
MSCSICRINTAVSELFLICAMMYNIIKYEGGEMKNLLQIFVAFVVCIGCTNLCTKSRKSMSAEEVVKAYLEVAFNMREVVEKRMLLQYATGSLKAAIAGSNDQTILEAYIKPRYHLRSMFIVSKKNITPREVRVTYQLEYQETSEKDDTVAAAIIKTKNTVSLHSIKGSWYIDGVVDNKTSIEFPLMRLKVPF